MKKLLATFGLVLSAALMHAQKIEIGFGAGYTRSELKNSIHEGSGFNAGVSAEYYFHKNIFGVKAKLAYSQKGIDEMTTFREIDEASGYSFIEVHSDFSLDYLVLPVTFEWHFGKKVQCNLGAGGYLGYLIHTQYNKKDFTIRDPEKFDTGIVVHLGAKIPVGAKTKIGLEYEGQKGFLSIYDSGSSGQNKSDSINFCIYYSL